MKYWDSSALVALHVKQASTGRVREIFTEDDQVVTWVLSDIEVRSALCRLAREDAMTEGQYSEAVNRVESFWDVVTFVSAVSSVKTRAKRLLGVHPIRAADALQLSAALTMFYDDPTGRDFVCLDERLSAAARREGFSVVP